MNEINNFEVVRKTKLAKSEFNVECNIAVQNQVTKILTISTVASVANCEVLNGSVSYAGLIDARIVYLNEDGEICTVNSVCPFTSKFECEGNGRALISVKVVETNVDSISQDIRLVCTLQQEGVLILSNEVKSATVEGDVCCKTEDIEVYRFVGEQTERATISSEVIVRQPLKKVILTESQAFVKSVESGVNFVTISGEVITRVLYLCEDDRFETSYLYENFKEELEVEGATRESQVEGYAFVKSEDVKTEVDESDKGTKINIEVTLLLNAKVYEKTMVSVIKDLYSTTSDVRLTTTSFDMTHVCPMSIVEGKIEGSLALDEDKPRVDKILFVGGNSVVVSNSFVADGEIKIEGIARTNVVYLNDELGTLNSVQIEVPFVLTDKFDFEGEGISVIDAVVCDVDVVVKKGRDFYYDARVKATVNFCHQIVCGIISDAELLEPFAEKDYGLELLFAQSGQSSWDIAKSARVKEEMLLEQNPEVTFPLEEDKSLVLYYQKVK